MSRIQAFLDKADADHVFLENTGWLMDATPDEVQRLYESYSQKYRVAVSEVAALLGSPFRQLPEDAAWFWERYPEAFEASVWQTTGGVVCLAAEHHDRETPVALVLRRLGAYGEGEEQ